MKIRRGFLDAAVRTGGKTRYPHAFSLYTACVIIHTTLILRFYVSIIYFLYMCVLY